MFSFRTSESITDIFSSDILNSRRILLYVHIRKPKQHNFKIICII